MAISLVAGGALFNSAVNDGSVSITLPTLLEDDVVYFGAAVGRSSIGSPTMTTAGYTQVGTASNGNTQMRVFRKVMGAVPDTTAVLAGTGGTGKDSQVAIVFCLRGVDTSTPEDAAATTATGSTTNPNPASITTVTDGAWVIPFAASGVVETGATVPSGYSNLTQANATDTNPVTGAGATKLVSTHAAEDPAAFGSWLTGDWAAVTVAVRPLLNVTVALTGQGAASSTGALTPALSKALSGQALASAQGSLGVTVSKALSGQVVASAQGSLGKAISKALSGSALTAAQGTVTADVGFILQLTGQAMSSAAGSLGVTRSVSLSGSAVAAAGGTLRPGVSLGLSGTAVVAAQGTLTAAVTIPYDAHRMFFIFG